MNIGSQDARRKRFQRRRGPKLNAIVTDATVTRVNINDNSRKRMAFATAVNEIAGKTPAQRFPSRMDIAATLLRRSIEVGPYSYKVSE